MPLRATGDAGDHHAFALDADQWAALKGNYKSLNLRMPCCQVPAVPKTSTLGNFFFAHMRLGECKTAPESAEHIFCKVLIAKAAAAAGWTVTTERQGMSPEGAAWVADVFCEKGTAQVALEVQMSPQTRDEASRRQARYKTSGVRAAWFYGEKLHRDLGRPSRNIPMFGLTAVIVGQEPKIGSTDRTLTEFVTALLNKKVTWVRPGHTEPFYISFLRYTCSQCKRPAGLAYGHASTLAELPVAPASIATVTAALGRIFEATTYAELESLGLCQVSRVHQARRAVAYMNGCRHCRVGVSTEHLFTLVTKAANGLTEPSGLEYLYFDRDALDNGNWVLSPDEGEYQGLSVT
jgi:hypothetical protein